MFTPTQDQQNALLAMLSFIHGPEQCFVLTGKAGTGKTTVVSLLEQALLDQVTTHKALGISVHNEGLPVMYSASTNKAAEALALATGKETGTVHRVFGIKLGRDYDRAEHFSYIRKGTPPLKPHIIIVDECSFIDDKILPLILRAGKHCKIIFMGDNAQLTPVNSEGMPVFDQGYPTAHLEQVMRQEEGPIKDICENVRNAVLTGKPLQKFTMSSDVLYLAKDQFEDALKQEFTRPDWKYGDSAVLAYTNATVNYYNAMLFKEVTGRSNFATGDYALANSFTKSIKGDKALKTEQTVHLGKITKKTLNLEGHTIEGRMMQINSSSFFVPDDLKLVDKIKVLLQKRENIEVCMDCMLDLRPLFSCTINKAQGSTFNTVYIDLDDLQTKVRDRKERMRLLYVAVSRARTKLVFTGQFSV